ncbi:MAG: hypothetical protein WC278_02915 [Bacilli bacterium]|jgi:hypothetical protein|nr:hypothetical protein [Bacilli bacterium]MDD2682477.1 hypothetical protein [Bacilli bacterium]MDD3121424.1 hypothetical protein [Bacilli bacterium]MDD4063283.1 hypothetical protein [Bacilli bacterium]MDD4482165.1 hypothetical protein [Bacilli bacterium]
MEERIKILDMLKEGIITVEEANELLKATTNSTDTEKEEKKQAEININDKKRLLHIKVISEDGDKVMINIPLKAVRFLFKNGKINKSIKLSGVREDFLNNSIDMDLINEFIESGKSGEIVNIQSEDGDIVNIYID